MRATYFVLTVVHMSSEQISRANVGQLKVPDEPVGDCSLAGTGGANDKGIDLGVGSAGRQTSVCEDKGQVLGLNGQSLVQGGEEHDGARQP